MGEHSRRIEDTPLGQMMYFWPAIIGGAMVLMSIGGYIATAKYLGDEQARQEVLIESIQKAQVDQISINSRLLTITESTEARLKSIEDWRNGVSDVYVRHRN